MSDIPALLDVFATDPWSRLASAVREGAAPQTLIAIVPRESELEVIREYARLALCSSGTAEDSCPSCRAWGHDGHPDLVIAGSGEKAPSIEECREFQSAIALRPVSSDLRVGAIPFVDEISIAASNALLKTAEEPPDGVKIILTASEDRLLPTIKSRAWIFRAHGGSLADDEIKAPPHDAKSWAAWMEQTKKMKAEGVAKDVEAWARWCASRGEIRIAADLSSFIYMCDKRHMPINMIQDALHAILREGVRVEQLFGDLRET